MATDNDRPRRLTEGGYLTEGRAAALERHLVQIEAVAHARMDELQRRIAELEGRELDLLRAQTRALLDLIQTRGGATT